MGETSKTTKENHITTDDLAFSAYLKMLNYPLIESHGSGTKLMFTFSVPTSEEKALRIRFVNSEFLTYYNELRNLKKLL
jgi:hypothetical protein